MINKIKICSVVSDLGIGGTARQLVTVDKFLNKEIFEHYIVSIGSGDKTRAKFIENKNIFFVGSVEEAVEKIRVNNVGVVYFQRHGRNEKTHDELAVVIPKNILVVELNTFSAFDKGVFGRRCDIHIFVSCVNVLKYIKQNDLIFDFDSQKVVYGLVDSESFKKNAPTEEEVNEFKKKYKLLNHFVVGRLARPTLSKWDERTPIFWKRLNKQNPDVKFVIYGVPPERKDRLLKSGNPENLTILEPTSSDKELALFYSSIDALVHLSPIGECNCGAIAEAMLFGKPVVVTTTPFPGNAHGKTHTRDNGQLEQIKNGENGFVVKSAQAMAKAVNYLSEQEAIARHMGEVNRVEIEKKYDVSIGIKTIEKIFIDGLKNKGSSMSKEILDYGNTLKYYPDKEVIQRWFAEYYERLNDVYKTNGFNIFDNFQYVFFIFLRRIKSLYSIIQAKI